MHSSRATPGFTHYEDNYAREHFGTQGCSWSVATALDAPHWTTTLESCRQGYPQSHSPRNHHKKTSYGNHKSPTSLQRTHWPMGQHSILQLNTHNHWTHHWNKHGQWPQSQSCHKSSTACWTCSRGQAQQPPPTERRGLRSSLWTTTPAGKRTYKKIFSGGTTQWSPLATFTP